MRDPGTLNRRIVIQKVSYASDKYGAKQTPTWTTHNTVWAALSYQVIGGSAEKEEAGLIVATNKVMFTIRYDSNVIPTWRVSYNSEIYEIERVNEVGRQHFMELVCKVKDNE